MNFARKRILADIKNVKKNEDLEKCGIHVKFNEENIYNAQALILGPSDTPYEKGFYLFDINFPSDYPMEPPKVKFCTLDPNIRFNASENNWLTENSSLTSPFLQIRSEDITLRGSIQPFDFLRVQLDARKSFCTSADLF